MAKKERERQKRETRRQAKLRRKEREQQRRVFIGLAILAVVIIGILAYGIINQYVIAPRAPIAVVDGTPIPTDAFQRRLAYQRFALESQLRQWQQFQQQLDPKGENPFISQQINQLAAQLNDIEGLSLQVLDEMIDEQLIREEAQAKGITVSPDEVQERINQFFGYDPEALKMTPEPTPADTENTGTVTTTVEPTPTPLTKEGFQKLYADYLQQVSQQALGFSEQEFRQLFEMDILKQKLMDAVCSDVPTTEEAVRARHILIPVETPTPEAVDEGTPTPTPDPELVKQAEEKAYQKALEIKRKLEDGADFAELAKEYSADPGSKDNGGDLGWFGRGRMVEEFEKAAFSLKPGEISDPVKTPFGYHIIQVLEKDPNHPRSEADIQRDKQECFSNWLAERRANAKIERHWSVDKIPPELRRRSANRG